ncbi:MAG TPA: tetratricopeptide repeat protein [Pyrinomonadaceae bacterium]|nr:tetratricopeptide repeat protein [Pyrinomonadaceae bacterium]
MNHRLFHTQTIIALLFILLAPLCAHAQKVSSSPARQFERVAALISENRIEEAEQQLNAILKASPNEALALNLLGTIRAKQGRLDDAEVLFTRAISIDNQFLGAHMNLAYLYLLKGMPDKTISELREVLRLDPNNPDVSYKLARLLISQGRADECINFIESMKQTGSLPLPLLVVLGDAYLKKGDTTRAEESYQLAINQQSASADALLGLAVISQSKGDTANAILYLNRVRDLITNSPDLLYSFARVALNSGLINDAMMALKRAVELKTDEPRYYFAFGLAWLQKPDLQEAEQAFRQFLKYQPDNPQGQLYLGYVLLKQKKVVEARALLEKSIQKNAGTPEPFYYLGLIAQEQREDEHAVSLFEKAINLAPSFASAHIALGSTYLKLKDFSRAQAELEAGVKLKPDDSKAHYNLALLYARLKDQQRSQEEMRIVEQLKGAGKAENKESEILAPSTSNPQ